MNLKNNIENSDSEENNIKSDINFKNLIYSSDIDEEKKEIIDNQNKILFNESNNNEINDKNDNKKISNLLFLLKQMSDKQLYLLDIISNLQKNSTEQINSLNNRIKNLEDKIKIQNKTKSGVSENEEKNTIYKYEIDDDDPNIILTKILNGNNNEELIKCLTGFDLGQIKKLDIKLIEDALMRLCILLTEGFKVHEIIVFIKGFLIMNKIKLKEITKKNLQDVFNFVQQNLKNIKDEDSIDISLIISYLNI